MLSIVELIDPFLQEDQLFSPPHRLLGPLNLCS